MVDVPLLDSPWPGDLDPAAVPFKVRTETVLRRAGYFDDPSRFDTLTETDVMAWWNAGVTTVADIRLVGNRAICLHHEDTDRRSEMNVALAAVAAEPWARHIWHRDPRFADHLPEVDMTVHDITASGIPDVRRSLWTRLENLRSAVVAQSALSLSEAIAQYVEAISGQRGRRLDVLLAHTGLNGRDPISGPTAAQMLGVSTARMYQIQIPFKGDLASSETPPVSETVTPADAPFVAQQAKRDRVIKLTMVGLVAVPIALLLIANAISDTSSNGAGAGTAANVATSSAQADVDGTLLGDAWIGSGSYTILATSKATGTDAGEPFQVYAARIDAPGAEDLCLFWYADGARLGEGMIIGDTVTRQFSEWGSAAAAGSAAADVARAASRTPEGLAVIRAIGC